MKKRRMLEYIIQVKLHIDPKDPDDFERVKCVMDAGTAEGWAEVLSSEFVEVDE